MSDRGLAAYSVERDREHVVLEEGQHLVSWSFAPDGSAIASAVVSGEYVTIQVNRLVGTEPEPPQVFESLWHSDLYWQP